MKTSLVVKGKTLTDKFDEYKNPAVAKNLWMAVLKDTPEEDQQLIQLAFMCYEHSTCPVGDEEFEYHLRSAIDLAAEYKKDPTKTFSLIQQLEKDILRLYAKLSPQIKEHLYK